MTANELMAGDWVRSKKWAEKPFKLTCLNANWRYYYGITSNEVLVGPFLIEELEPIPLTPEILEKNGFVCTQKADEMETAYECWSFHDGLLSIVFEPDVVMLEVHNGGENGDAVRTMTYYTDNDIMYLHELQHALILCKIEKKIEL